MAAITLFGASGMIGQRVLREALDRGHGVTAVVRDPTRITERRARLTVERGDAADSADVARLTSGADAVVNAVGPPRGPGADPSAFLTAAARGVLAGLRGGGKTPYLVVVGGAGTLETAPGVRLLDTPGFPDMARQEALAQGEVLDLLRGVPDVTWTYLAPSARIGPGERTGVFRLGTDRLIADAEGNSLISAEDYAIAVLDEIENPRHAGKRFTAGY